MHTNNFLLQIFKITNRENFTFFQKRKIFKFGIHVHRWKKNRKKNVQFFFRTPKLQNKQFAISKISNTKFRKIHYFANIKYKRNSQKYCEKNLNRNIFGKKKIFAKKNSIIKISTKKKFVEKNFRKNFFFKSCKFFYIWKNIRLIFEKKNRKNFENNFCNFFIN